MSQRAIYEIRGKDREHFLQGLVTNDVRKLAQGPLYAALLTPQGKYLADFLLVPWGEAILLDIDAILAEATVKRLSMYKLRADVTITPSTLQVSRGTGPAPEGALPDPRHPALGWRLYGETSGDDSSDWAAIRVANGIPETGIELTPETYILEVGFEPLHGVDFRKGCYVGQEVTARMKHKTELRKGLTRVLVSAPVPVGTPIEAQQGQDWREIGTLYTQSSGAGLAYLRFDKAKGAMRAGLARVTLPHDLTFMS